MGAWRTNVDKVDGRYQHTPNRSGSVIATTSINFSIETLAKSADANEFPAADDGEKEKRCRTPIERRLSLDTHMH
jgi:hypothetical protein